MSVVDSVRRGWRLLDRRARRDFRYVAVINLAATIGMFFYPEEDIAYRFSSEEVYVASLDYLNGAVLPLWGFMFFAGMVCLIVAISLLVHAYRIVRGAYMEERFPGRELPDRAAWPFLPAVGLYLGLVYLANFVPSAVELAPDLASGTLLDVPGDIAALVIAALLVPWMFRRFVLPPTE